MTDDAEYLLTRLVARQEALARRRRGDAREATIIRECLTRLRMGQAVSIVEAHLLEAEVHV